MLADTGMSVAPRRSLQGNVLWFLPLLILRAFAPAGLSTVLGSCEAESVHAI